MLSRILRTGAAYFVLGPRKASNGSETVLGSRSSSRGNMTASRAWLMASMIWDFSEAVQSSLMR